MPRDLTVQEKQIYEYIRQAHPQEIALIQTEFDGEETAVICDITVEVEATADDIGKGEGSLQAKITPLAVLVTPAMFPKLVNPAVGL